MAYEELRARLRERRAAARDGRLGGAEVVCDAVLPCADADEARRLEAAVAVLGDPEFQWPAGGTSILDFEKAMARVGPLASASWALLRDVCSNGPNYLSRLTRALGMAPVSLDDPAGDDAYDQSFPRWWQMQKAGGHLSRMRFETERTDDGDVHLTVRSPHGGTALEDHPTERTVSSALRALVLEHGNVGASHPNRAADVVVRGRTVQPDGTEAAETPRARSDMGTVERAATVVVRALDTGTVAERRDAMENRSLEGAEVVCDAVLPCADEEEAARLEAVAAVLSDPGFRWGLDTLGSQRRFDKATAELGPQGRAAAQVLREMGPRGPKDVVRMAWALGWAPVSPDAPSGRAGHEAGDTPRWSQMEKKGGHLSRMRFETERTPDGNVRLTMRSPHGGAAVGDHPTERTVSSAMRAFALEHGHVGRFRKNRAEDVEVRARTVLADGTEVAETPRARSDMGRLERARTAVVNRLAPAGPAGP